MAETPFERSSTAGSNRTKRDGSVLSGTPARGYNTNKIEPEAEKPARKRARTSKGHYKSDDPSTPDVNEAYVVDSSE